MQTIIRPATMLTSSILFWLGMSLIIGFAANKLPERWLSSISKSKIRSNDSNKDQHTKISQWKKWVPDAGACLPGGIAKKKLVKKDCVTLENLLKETRRAEIVHYSLWLSALTTIAWLPKIAVIINVIVACILNAPCLILQRQTQARVHRLIAKLRRREYG